MNMFTKVSSHDAAEYSEFNKLPEVPQNKFHDIYGVSSTLCLRLSSWRSLSMALQKLAVYYEERVRLTDTQ